MAPNLNLPTCATVLLVMRVYAIYCRSRWILFVVTLEFIAAFVTACWILTKFLSGLAARNTERRARLQGVAFSALLIFDFTVFVLTMARSIKLWTHKEPFIHRIFIDGLLYYGVIWNLNLVNVIALFATNRNHTFHLSTPIITNVLSVVMITRLMINLRDPTIHTATDRDGVVTTSHIGYVSTLVLD